MSPLEMQFMEPHEMWDEYAARKEAGYQSLVKGKTCLDCGRCRKPDPYTGHSGIGFCLEDGEFVFDDAFVSEIGCRSFVEGDAS